MMLFKMSSLQGEGNWMSEIYILLDLTLFFSVLLSIILDTQVNISKYPFWQQNIIISFKPLYLKSDVTNVILKRKDAWVLLA